MRFVDFSGVLEYGFMGMYAYRSMYVKREA